MFRLSAPFVAFLLLSSSPFVSPFRSPTVCRGRTRLAASSYPEDKTIETQQQPILNDLQENLSNVEDLLGAEDLTETSSLNDHGLLANNIALLSIGTFGLTMLLGTLLANFEWMQSWRYLWPLVGGLYVVQAHQNLQSTDENDSGSKLRILPFGIIESTWWNLGSAVFGVGLIVGGAYDAFMPVWMTGPNLLTDAGIGHDSALALLGLSVYGICTQNAADAPCDSSESLKNLQNNPTATSVILLLQVILLSQLCILGEGSINALVADVSDVLLS
jgi:hypothetical protein